MGIRLTILVLLLISNNIDGRPISYSGGSTLMMFSDNMKDSIYYHYSPTYKYSVGIEQVKDKYFKENSSYLRLTYLADRKNTQNSQRNLYLQSGLSTNGADDYFYGAHGDWETRRWFVGFGLKKVKKEMVDYGQQYLQMGVAPYLGEYGDLHTWLMIKTKKNSLNNDWSTYPVIKFFKGVSLIEFGYNNKTEWDVNYIYRF